MEIGTWSGLLIKEGRHCLEIRCYCLQKLTLGAWLGHYECRFIRKKRPYKGNNEASTCRDVSGCDNHQDAKRLSCYDACLGHQNTRDYRRTGCAHQKMAGAIFGQEQALLGAVCVRSKLARLVQGTFVLAEGKSRQAVFGHGGPL